MTQEATRTPLSSTRDRIFLEAFRAFRDRGYDGTTLEEIARASGITSPAIYRHFAGKQEILVAILEHAGELFAPAVRRAAQLPPKDALECLVDRLVDIALAEEGFLVLWVRNRHHLPADYRGWADARERSYIEEWVRALSRMRPALTLEDALATVQSAIGVIVAPAVFGLNVSPERLRVTLRSHALAVLATDA